MLRNTIDFAPRLKTLTKSNLLDGKAKVSLVDFSPRMIPLDDSGRRPEHFVAAAARMSFNNGGYKSVEKDNKLINYLAKHRHTSPFEMCNVTYQLTIPNFVAKQILRHRTFKFNEVSQRYTKIPEDCFYEPDKFKINEQDSDKKQCAKSFEDEERMMQVIEEVKDINKVLRHLNSRYNNLLNMGMSRESARYCLPSGTYTTLLVSADLNNLCKMLSLRLGEDSQIETRIIAQAMKELAHPCFPISMDKLIV